MNLFEHTVLPIGRSPPLNPDAVQNNELKTKQKVKEPQIVKIVWKLRGTKGFRLCSFYLSPILYSEIPRKKNSSTHS